jgi:hypothetical protein
VTSHAATRIVSCGRPRRQTPPHRPGLASGHTIEPGAIAARWGQFLNLGPRDDAALTTPGNPGDQSRTEPLAVPPGETGYRLGQEQGGES